MDNVKEWRVWKQCGGRVDLEIPLLGQRMGQVARRIRQAPGGEQSMVGETKVRWWDGIGNIGRSWITKRVNATYKELQSMNRARV